MLMNPGAHGKLWLGIWQLIPVSCVVQYGVELPHRCNPNHKPDASDPETRGLSLKSTRTQDTPHRPPPHGV